MKSFGLNFCTNRTFEVTSGLCYFGITERIVHNGGGSLNTGARTGFAEGFGDILRGYRDPERVTNFDMSKVANVLKWLPWFLLTHSRSRFCIQEARPTDVS